MSTKDPAGKESTGTTEEEVAQLIEVQGDAEKATLEDIWVAGIPLGKIIEGNRKTAESADKKAEEAVSTGSKGGGDGSETRPQDGDSPDRLPIETLALLEEDESADDAVMAEVTPSIERATTIFKHFQEWSTKAPKGQVIKSNLKALLTTATGENLAWRQVYRAAKKLQEWSKNRIVFKKHRRHGWMLIDTGERSSSAGTG